MEWIANPDIWISLVTLAALEIVLGIDNLVFIAILSERVAPEKQRLARNLGLGFALGSRLVLLFAISWLMTLTRPLFEVFGEGISWRDIILIVGGLFLLAKATYEIDHMMEGPKDEDKKSGVAAASLTVVVVQIAIIDVVFSFDSVITAVGMAKHIEVMIAAIVIAMTVMLLSAGPVARFVSKHPTFKMLALSFLLLIGVMLVADGFGLEIPKGYIYFAMGFSILVEVLNMAVRRARGRPTGKVDPDDPARYGPVGRKREKAAVSGDGK